MDFPLEDGALVSAAAEEVVDVSAKHRTEYNNTVIYMYRYQSQNCTSFWPLQLKVCTVCTLRSPVNIEDSCNENLFLSLQPHYMNSSYSLVSLSLLYVL